MTDNNITEKLTDTISSIIKKSDIPSKIDKTSNILISISLFCLISSAFTFISNITLINIYKENLKLNKKVTEHDCSINNLYQLIKTNHSIPNSTSTSTSTSDFEMYLNKLNTSDELADECYDNIPLNNHKKASFWSL